MGYEEEHDARVKFEFQRVEEQFADCANMTATVYNPVAEDVIKSKHIFCNTNILVVDKAFNLNLEPDELSYFLYTGSIWKNNTYVMWVSRGFREHRTDQPFMATLIPNKRRIEKNEYMAGYDIWYANDSAVGGGGVWKCQKYERNPRFIKTLKELTKYPEELD